MPATEIPPRNPSPSLPVEPLAADLFDARRWESAYRELHDVPSLLVQLQDDLARSRKSEAFWISVVFHLVVITLFVNSQRLERFFPHKTLVVGPHEWLRQRELTYLELPPDAQKITKKPDTNVISDKDRIATSKTPQLNRDELKKILDSARAGRPGPSGPPTQSQPSPPAAQQPAQTAQAGPPQAAQPPPPPQFDTQPRVQNPVEAAPRGSFDTGGMSAGAAIANAARAAAANRGGGYGGDNGDYGLGTGRQASGQIGPLDILSDTQGVDFGPYLARVLHDVKYNWYNLIPEAARAPLMKKGKVSIEFAILKDGRVAGMNLAGTSGDVALDRAAWGGITASNPFPPLPGEFHGQYLALRFHFYYNPDRNDLQ